MTEFDAYYYKCKFYINGVKEYTLGEILEKYLSKNFKDLDELLYMCRNYMRDLHYPEDDEEARNCDVFFQRAIMFYSKVEDLICSLPPYKDMDLRRNKLYDLLNEYYWFWEVECEEGDPRWLDYNYHFVTDLPLDSLTDADNLDKALEFNRKLNALATEYCTFVEDIIRVRNVFEPFLERVHSQSKFLDNNETAEVYSEFMKETEHTFEVYDKLTASGNMNISYKVINSKKSSILCEQYHFDTIGAFLYIELFKGLEQHYLPKKCGYCGKYFLLKSGYYSDYCTRPVKDKEGKVCRDVGHRKKYADKVKDNPEWNVYLKAYKQHYARFLKKKMTQTEFQKWADFALEMRQKAIDKEIDFEEYKRIMRE